MLIRKAKEDDLERILQIYGQARSFMRGHGNPTQWEEGYPSIDLIRRDLNSGSVYVFESGDAVHGVFSFIEGEDPTYKVIREGSWHHDGAYGTIHRLASDGSVHGLSRLCFDHCIKLCPYLRIDTHKDNIPMRRAIENYGFARCGIITVRDGSARIAFDFKR